MNRIGTLTLLLAILCGCTPAAQTGAPAKPNPLPVVEEVQPLPGRGVAIEGSGSARTIEILPDAAGPGLGVLMLTASHNGQSTFVVSAVQGNQAEVATRAIGQYRGRRPLVVHSPVAFEVLADGDWELSLQPMPRGGQPAFNGTGDDVSPYFDPPPPATWNIAHSGEAGFVVYAHCLGGGSVLVADHTGAVKDARQIEFARGPCFWEVRADGAWSLTPTS
jgi:hypothetical protein